jgi:hypothetical protein
MSSSLKEENTIFIPVIKKAATFAEALVRDPIGIAQAIVQACRASGQRREHLQRVITDGNKNHDFGDTLESAVVVPQLQLLRDVETRWDSVYLMIRRLRVLRLVSIFVLEVTHAHCLFLRASMHFLLTLGTKTSLIMR